MVLAGSELDIRELERQNRITQQILQRYLERRLFPHRRSKAPTVWEILPIPRTRTQDDNIEDVLGVRLSPETETLQSVESEQISAVYEEDEDYQGMQK